VCRKGGERAGRPKKKRNAPQLSYAIGGSNRRCKKGEGKVDQEEKIGGRHNSSQVPEEVLIVKKKKKTGEGAVTSDLLHRGGEREKTHG